MDSKKKKLLEDVAIVGTVAGAGVAIVAGHPEAAAAITVIRPILSEVAKFLRDSWRAASVARGEEFVIGLLEDGAPVESAAAAFQAELQKAPEETKATILTAMRAVDEAVLDEVVTPLALLTREYVNKERARDKFFIGAIRLLRDTVSVSDLAALRGFVAFVVQDWPQDPAKQQPRETRILRSAYNAHGRFAAWGGESGHHQKFDDVSDRVLRDLLEHKLASETTTGKFYAGMQALDWWFQWDTMSRLHEILRA